MDQERFDDLTRLLGASGTRRTGLRAALGGLLGLGAAAAAADASAKRRHARGGDDAEAAKGKHRRKKCKPACTAGFECVKVGRKRECQCPSGVVCGVACCAAGEPCVDGVCGGAPEPTCVAAGETCKNAGVPCCDGRVCSSGQGGDGDIACYVPKTGRCERSADCVYGMRCRSGRCEPPQPGDLGEPCDAAAQQLCTTPGAVCTAYTGAGAPAGAFCSLPLQRTCTVDPDCTCYRCWYTEASLGLQGRRGRGSANANAKACCHAAGLSCAADDDCCLGLACVNGACSGTLCTPDDTAGCSADVPCCNPSATCVGGTCSTCGPTTCPNGCCRDGQCVPYASQAVGTCGTLGVTCAACPTPTNACKVAACTNGVCGEANATNGTACPGGTCVSGSCCTSGCVSSGTCVAYASQSASTCGTGGAACAACDPCKIATCTSGVCGGTNRADGGACSFGAVTGFCKAGTCVACDATTCPDGCCNGGATGTCVKTAGMNNGTCGTGTAGATCQTCSATTSCSSGSCASGCTPGTSCDVQPTCASGLGTTCWESIKAAYDALKPASADPNGAPIVITIAPGVYSEATTYIAEVPSVTFKRCGDCGSVVWQNAAGSSDDLLDIDAGNAGFSLTVTVEDIDFRQQVGASNNQTPSGIFALTGDYDSSWNGSTYDYTYFRAKLVLDGCTFADADYTAMPASTFAFYMVDADVYSDIEFTGCTFRNIHLPTAPAYGILWQYAGVVYSSGQNAEASTSPDATRAEYNTLKIENSVLEDITGGYAGPLYLYYTVGTITGSTFRNCSLSGYRAYYGGMIYLDEEGYLAISDTTLASGIVDNVGVPAPVVSQGTPNSGAGGGITVSYGYDSGNAFALDKRVTGSSEAKVKDNAYGNCVALSDVDSRFYTVDCDDWCIADGGTCSAADDCCGNTCTGQTCSTP